MAARLALVHGQSCCRSLSNFLVRIGERTLNEVLQSMMDLARRAVACEGWWWMPRMVDTEGMTYLGVVGWALEVHLFADGRRESRRETLDGTLPDLTDPATLGCVLALVAERHSVTLDDVHVVRTTGRAWSVWVFAGDDASLRVATHLPSRAAALVAALEAAPVGGAS